MIVEVIVDVAAYPIDRPFDYIVPEAFQTTIERGIRVKVPFGRRKVVGYVTNIKNESELALSKLRPIEELIDIEPVLSEEQLMLSRWLATETLAYQIDALQVMLPAAMRAKYDKFIVVQDSEKIQDENFQRLLAGRKRIPLSAINDAGLFRILKSYVAEEIVTVDTAVQQQVDVKKVRTIHIEEREVIASERDNSAKCNSTNRVNRLVNRTCWTICTSKTNF